MPITQGSDESVFAALQRARLKEAEALRRLEEAEELEEGFIGGSAAGTSIVGTVKWCARTSSLQKRTCAPFSLPRRYPSQRMNSYGCVHGYKPILACARVPNLTRCETVSAPTRDHVAPVASIGSLRERNDPLSGPSKCLNGLSVRWFAIEPS